ncbi:carbohydrate kinase family protein [Pandoraea pnomenusa]|uniref:carbohydrate kinase family protein n=1 Tax=Pandoraea pnomenusa TaxID=93220 RepID=UPI00243089B8|nr:carbohydrate kinase family protein [Pandoraea pnomenusa]
MTTVICGSLAYDNIMTFEGRFGEHILPDQVHILNVSFLVPTMRRNFGGCAGNIGYSLNLLGGSPVVMGAVGEDGGAYIERLESLGMSTAFVRTIADSMTANAMITTDLDNNQITAFHPGAMMFSAQNRVADVRDATLGIVAPDAPDAMLAHAEGFAAARVPFVFDPGQGLPLLSAEALRRMVELATYLAVNDYEAKLLCTKTGWSMDDLQSRVEALVVTRGEHGALIFADGKQHDIPAVTAKRVVDPTGCGDAFRGGLLYGIEKGLDWPTTGRLASLMGSLKISEQGPQTYAPTRAEIEAQYQEAFGHRFE